MRDGVDRSRYVYEGPNGTARDERDYSPHVRMRVTLGDIVSQKRDPIGSRSGQRRPEQGRGLA